MATYHYDRIKNSIATALVELPSSVVLPAAGIASAIGGVEAYRQVAFEDLPAHVIHQLRQDGTRGDLRTLEEAKAVYEQNVNAEAQGSVEGVASITNDTEIDWGHKLSFEHGGSNEAGNGVYLPESLNSSIGERAMTAAQIEQSEQFTRAVAEEATPGVTGDLSEVVGDTLETGALGGVMGGGLAVAHRYAQAQGFRDAGRHDLAAAAEREMVADAAKGAVNGVVRGTTVAVTQAVLGANPLTAGIGLVAPDVVMLLSRKEQLSEEEYQQKSLEVVGKGALATVLVCAGPIGWLGLAGLSIATAYGQANQQAASRRAQA